MWTKITILKYFWITDLLQSIFLNKQQKTLVKLFNIVTQNL